MEVIDNLYYSSRILYLQKTIEENQLETRNLCETVEQIYLKINAIETWISGRFGVKLFDNHNPIIEGRQPIILSTNALPQIYEDHSINPTNETKTIKNSKKITTLQQRSQKIRASIRKRRRSAISSESVVNHLKQSGSSKGGYRLPTINIDNDCDNSDITMASSSKTVVGQTQSPFPRSGNSVSVIVTRTVEKQKSSESEQSICTSECIDQPVSNTLTTTNVVPIPTQGDDNSSSVNFAEGLKPEPGDGNIQKRRGRPKKNPDEKVRNYKNRTPMVCDQCGKVLKGSSSLRSHKKTHSTLRPYACDKCSKAFRMKHHLDFHLLTHDEGQKKWTCRFCDKGFIAQRDLLRHERTHTGERPFPCSMEGCSKSFNVKQHLKLHLRTHTKDKPYKCQICFKNFTQANSLRIHKKIHIRGSGGDGAVESSSLHIN